mgnify:CR=1 FL=1
MAERVRNQEVDILRGIAAVLMILGHSFIVYPVNIATVPWCAAIGHFIYTFHMELFFILAGYVYHCISYKSYMKKKTERIALPYFVFGVGAMLLRAFGGAAINGIEPVGEGIVKLLFRGGGYWFLYVSFLIFAVYPLLDHVLSKSIVIEAVFCGVILIVDQYVKVTDFLSLETVVHYLPYFVIGHIVAKINGGRGRTKTAILISSLIIYVVLDSYEISNDEKLGTIFHFIRAVSMCYVVFCLSKVVFDRWGERKSCIQIKAFLTECSKYSLQIYLFNGYLLTAIRIILCNILKIRSPFLIASTIWIGDLAISLILCKYILPKMRLLARLCGIK